MSTLRCGAWLLGVLWLHLPALAQPAAVVGQRVVVYDEPGQFAAWPAGHGMWRFGNELLVGFSVGALDRSQRGHAIARDKPEHHVLSRSLDGGLTWKLETPQQKGMLVNKPGMRKGTLAPGLTEGPPRPIRKPLDFADPNFCMTLRLTHNQGGDSRLYTSRDRGRSWHGPFQVPDFGQPGVMARTDYVVQDRDTCLVLLTVSKTNRREGRILATRMTRGGRDWIPLGMVGPEPAGFSIMPATVRLGPEELLLAARRRSGDGQRRFIELWHSEDGGRLWTPRGVPVSDLGSGNPPALVRLADQRLCLTYGVRKAPHNICAQLSADAGRTWSKPIVLRTGGGSSDIGYTRTVQRPDGAMVTVYYYVPEGAECPRIEAVIWRPPVV